MGSVFLHCLFLLLFVLLVEGAVVRTMGTEDDVRGALSSAGAGDSFTLRAGNYTALSGVAIANAITLRGEPGAIIDCMGTQGLSIYKPINMAGLVFTNCIDALSLYFPGHVITNSTFLSNKRVINPLSNTGVSISFSSFLYNSEFVTGPTTTTINVSFSLFERNGSPGALGLVSTGGTYVYESRYNRYISNTVTSISLNGLSTLVMDSDYYFNNTGSSFGVVQFAGNSTLVNCTFDRNFVAVGSAIGRINSKDTWIRNCTFTNNTGGSESIIFSNSVTNKLVIEDSRFLYNAPNSNAKGSILFTIRSQVIVHNCEFIGNQANQGGLFYLHLDSSIILSSSLAIGNSATSSGGIAELYSNSFIEIIDSHFESNSASFASIIRFDQVSTSGAQQSKITNCTFLDNHARSRALFVVNGITLSIMNCSFPSNRANALEITGQANCSVSHSSFSNNRGYSSMIYTSGSNVNFSDVIFENNVVPEYSFDLTSSTVAKVHNLTMYNNTGALRTQLNSQLTLSSSSFVNNTNGTIVLNKSSAIITNILCDGNKAGNTNGASCLFSVESNSVISSSNFSNNVGTVNGAALIAQGTTNITNCAFTSNFGSRGGALHISNSSIATLVNLTLVDNSASVGGGLSISRNASVQLLHSHVSNNTAQNGGGVELFLVAYSFIYNCTIENNKADSQGRGGGILVLDSKVEVDKTILINNEAGNGGGVYLQSNTARPKSLFAANIITDNKARNNSGIGMDFQDLLLMRDTLLSTDTPSYPFCCSNSKTSNPFNSLCNFPVCGSGCLESENCNCPFEATVEFDSGIYVMPTVNDTCTCDYNFYGSNCEAYNCSNSNCSPHAVCYQPSAGEYNCTCNRGYDGNGFECEDINECQPTSSCPHVGPAYMCINTNGSFDCVCAPGYENYPACFDINECVNNNCSANATCTDEINAFSCNCSFGYTGDGFNCTEINECENNNCNSNATCIDSIGHFICLCNQGFDSDGNNCTEIDECLHNTCNKNATCYDLINDYDCKCNHGFTGDGFTCDEINRCTNVTCGSNATCTSKIGDYECTCDNGFIRDGDNCTEINECINNPHCDANATCVDRIAGFDCKCNYGFSGNGSVCTKINECENNDCSSNATCVDQLGQYGCTCNFGFEGNGTDCSEINECKNHTCGSNATCIDLIGDFNCTCDYGYRGDGYNCNEINECDNNNCSRNATCIDKIGYFDCICEYGFNGTGYACSKIDECENHNCTTNATCVDKVGYFECTCKSGFSGDGTNCTDDNECLINPAICNGQHCVNTPGRFECLPCPVGFDGPSCADIDECTDNNGGCDQHVACNNTYGSRTCGECPFGFSGSGDSKCEALCGNEICEPELKEDCVTCPMDCTKPTCDKCGDGQCDLNLGENCQSCFVDCASTCLPVCPQCVHGVCSSGLCTCSIGWTGPTCSVPILPVNITTNTSNPSAVITPMLPSNLPNIQFGISIRRLTERGQNMEQIVSFDVAQQTYVLVQSYLLDTKNIVWEYSAVLSNGAIINVTFIRFTEPSTIYSFHNITNEFATNTLKINFRVAKWPFKSISHTLDVEMDNSVSGDSSCDPSTKSQDDSGGNLQWLKISLNGVTEYVQFVPEAYVDGRKRITKFSAINSNIVTATLPHFWLSAEFDPHYTVLLDPIDSGTDECGNPIKSSSSKSSDTGMIVGVTVGVIAAAAIAGVALFVLAKKRHNVTKKRISMRQSVELKHMNSSSPMYRNNGGENPLFTESQD